MKLVLDSLLVLALPLAVAHADGPRHHPPQAAFDACAKAKADDACSFKLREHNISGKCAPRRASRRRWCAGRIIRWGRRPRRSRRATGTPRAMPAR